MKKRNMHLVSDRNTKKKYNKFYIVMCDESTYEFDLNEWKVFRGEEWVEVEKNDGTEMNCFSIGNIMRVRFAKVESKKDTVLTDVSVIKPVPPMAV